MKQKLSNCLNNIEKYVIITIFTMLLLMMIFGVISRYGLGISVAWIEQMTRLLFVWLSFAGISYGAMKRQHLKVEALAVFLKGKKGAMILLIGDLIASVFALFLSYRIATLTMNVYDKGQSFSAMPWMPVWVMYLSGLLGMAGMGIRTIQFGIIPGLHDIKDMK